MSDKHPNLRYSNRWQPGKSGNPKGRPKKPVSLTSMLKQRLTPQIVLEIIEAWLHMVTKGHNVQALQEMLNRLEGKVAEKHEHEAKLPINIVFQPIYEPAKLKEANVVEGECKELEPHTHAQ